jgi:hypothetical protein
MVTFLRLVDSANRCSSSSVISFLLSIFLQCCDRLRLSNLIRCSVKFEMHLETDGLRFVHFPSRCFCR